MNNLGIKHKLAKVAFWAQYTPEQKSVILSFRAKKMWKNKTKQQKKDRALLMLNGKRAKKAQLST